MKRSYDCLVSTIAPPVLAKCHPGTWWCHGMKVLSCWTNSWIVSDLTHHDVNMTSLYGSAFVAFELTNDDPYCTLMNKIWVVLIREACSVPSQVSYRVSIVCPWEKDKHEICIVHSSWPCGNPRHNLHDMCHNWHQQPLRAANVSQPYKAIYSQIPECICATSHNATFCNRNVHMCTFLL